MVGVVQEEVLVGGEEGGCVLLKGTDLLFVEGLLEV